MTLNKVKVTYTTIKTKSSAVPITIPSLSQNRFINLRMYANVMILFYFVFVDCVKAGVVCFVFLLFGFCFGWFGWLLFIVVVFLFCSCFVVVGRGVI